MPRSRRTEGLRVLVVDDHGPMRQVARRIIAGLPYVGTVVESGSGEDALDRFDELRPDVVVMDAAMGGMSGIDATAQLHASHPGLPIIGWTAVDDYTVHREFREAGAIAVVTKDNLAQLRSLITRIATGGSRS